VPDQPTKRANATARFKRIMARMAIVSLLAAVVAAFIVAQDPDVPIHALIATGLGVGLTVLLGTALMSLAFLSSAGGYDAESGRSQSENRDQ
jgi:hypothetical protein